MPHTTANYSGVRGFVSGSKLLGWYGCLSKPLSLARSRDEMSSELVRRYLKVSLTTFKLAVTDSENSIN